MQHRTDSLRHALLLAACLSGIVGIGMVFQGVMDGSVAEMSRGAPFLLLGTWWAGRELGRSMLAARSRKG